MSKWLEKQLKYYVELMLPKTGTYVVRTNDITLSNLLNKPEYREAIQKDIAKKVGRGFDFGEFLIEELRKEYKKITDRKSEWSMGGYIPGIEGDWTAYIYLFPTDKEINFKLKTKKWRWETDEFERWVVTKGKGYHVGCFHKPIRVFIRVNKLDTGVIKNG